MTRLDLENAIRSYACTEYYKGLFEKREESPKVARAELKRWTRVSKIEWKEIQNMLTELFKERK